MNAGMQMLIFYPTVLLIIFLIFRAFWLWYWRINRIVQLLEQQVEQTQRVEAQLLNRRAA